MAASSVATDYAAVVQELYIAYFGRPADYYGLASFENALVAAAAPTDFATLNATLQSGSNGSLNALVNGFSSSAESVALYGTGTDTISISKFVNAIYNNVLNRDADTAGLSFWVSAITSGTLTQADAAVAITAAATANTTDQGKIDAAVVANKVVVAGDFTQDLTTASEINGYSGDAAAATARALLGTVTDSTDLIAFQATITSTIATIVNGTGTTTALTIGEDDITGTSANDIFTATTVTASGGAVSDTLNSIDVINGGAGTNTLKATISGTGAAPTLTNVQNVDLRFVNAAATLDLANATGVTTVVVANSTTIGSVLDVGTVSTLGVSNQNSSVTFSGNTATTLNLALDTFGTTVTGGVPASVVTMDSGATTLNLTTNNSTAGIVAGTVVKTLTIGATGSNEILLAAPGSVTTVTVTGTGSLALDTELTAVTKFDASANSGGVTVDLGTVAKTVVGSAGDDMITLDAVVAKASVNLGAGNDVLVLNGVVAAGAVIDGGAGDNTVVINDATDLTAYTATTLKTALVDFTTLEINDGATGAGLTVDAALFTGITSYVVDAGTAVAISDLGATTALTIDGDITTSLTLTSTAAVVTAGTGAVALTLDNGSPTDGTDGVTVASLNTDAATLTIHSNGLISDTGADNSVTLDDANGAALTSVVIDGSQAVDFHTGALTALATAVGTLTVDASTATGSVLIDAATATAVVNMNGGSAADVLTAGIAGGTIYGGAGGDSIDLTATTGVGAVDTIVYKAATDSVYSVATSGALGSGIDTITNFVSSTDKIDLTGLGLTASSVIVDKTAASLSALTTLAASATFYNDSTNTARSVVEVTVGSDTYLFVDANKDHKFDASTDLVIHLTGATQTVAAGDIIFA